MVNGIKEKTITLDVGLMVAGILQERGFRVLLTRKHDATLSVEQRVHTINKTVGADLLVSVHANSGPCHAQGVETYCINSSGFFGCSTVLNKESQAYIINNDRCRYQQSDLLACAIQKHVVSSAQAPDRGVRYAITRLLLGVEMPAVLVEIGYLSNQDESLRLVQASYQQKIAHGICDGVREYFNMH